MNLLITAGGTKEDIDPVRGISNYATGRLGSLIARRFIQGENTVTYICGETSIQPPFSPNLEVKTIRSTAQLAEQMEAALRAKPYDAVIHSMAVSDYAPCYVADKKISSDLPYLIVVLKRLPKVIQCVKEIQPNTLLIGFKLIAGGASEEELIQAANKLIEKSRSDYVLANALEDIKEDYHKGILINRDGIAGRGNSKDEIAEMIYENCNSWYNRKHSGL